MFTYNSLAAIQPFVARYWNEKCKPKLDSAWKFVKDEYYFFRDQSKVLIAEFKAARSAERKVGGLEWGLVGSIFVKASVEWVILHVCVPLSPRNILRALLALQVNPGPSIAPHPTHRRRTRTAL